MLKHLCSAISHGGVERLQGLQQIVWVEPGRYLVRLSDAFRRESFER